VSKRSAIGVPVWVVVLTALTCGGQAGEKTDGHTFELKPKQIHQMYLCFDADKEVAFQVRSEKESDVDLFVFDQENKLVAKDDAISKDCNAKFTPSKMQFYRIVVANLGPGDNKSKLTYTGAEVKVEAKKLDAVELKTEGKVTYEITFAANKPAAIWVDGEKETDIDLFVFDGEGKRVASDERISKDSFVTFTPAKAQAYRVEVINLGPGDNRAVVKHTGVKAEKK
jgi:hypothetical protein